MSVKQELTGGALTIVAILAFWLAIIGAMLL